jgi:NAD(P)-dependent dehydrogenase (short-subunit alcohol dehydrogenase family)
VSDLSGKLTAIIGGSTGIGLATAQAVTAVGGRVAITGRSREKLDRALETLNDDVSAHPFDGRDSKAMEQFFNHVGRLDHLVLTMNTGGGMAPLTELDDGSFRVVFDNKFWPYVDAIRLAMTHLNADGSVVMVTGAAGRRAVPGATGIAATNGALMAMLGPLALELAPRRINAVSPGVIDTPYWETVADERRAKMFEMAASKLPVGRVGTAEEVAEAVLFTMTNTFTTGAIIDCDGGTRLQ